MTMLVDRRKDNYDELLVLARDSRLTRARTNRWTSGLVIGAMAATGAYVATTNQQVEDLRETATKAEKQLDTIRNEYTILLNEHHTLMFNIDIFTRQQDLLADIGPTLILSQSIAELAKNLGGESSDDQSTVVETRTTHIATSNIVWMVDGSRRFPVINGDIVWVPEGNFWIRFQGTTPSSYELYRHSTKPVGSPATGGRLLDVLPYKEEVTRGTSNCIEIRLHDESIRPLFRAAKYADIEITYFISDKTNPCK